MTTPQTDTSHPQAPDFGEPWHNEEGDFEIYRQTQNDAVAYAEGTKTRGRIIACVNALAGIPDPAEFVRQAKEMREAVKRIANWRGDCDAYNEAIREVAQAMDNLIIAKRGDAMTYAKAAFSKPQPFLKP
jgi:hypothetical protein